MGEYSKSAIIKYTRAAKRMTQEELAETICDPVTLSRYESGKIDPPDDKFFRLMRKMGERGDIYLFPINSISSEIDKQMTKILYAVERQEWKIVDQIKHSMESSEGFPAEYPENRQYMKRIDVISQYNQGNLMVKESIEELVKAWRYTSQSEPENFPLNRILGETEILLLFNLATFYKIAGKSQNSLALYERLDNYFERKDMDNDYKPVYLIYVGYSNLLGEMGYYEKSIHICFKAINKLLMNNQTNYLYNFYYNVGWNIVKQADGNKSDPRINDAKLYIWLAYQLCKKYPEDKRNLEKIIHLYHELY